VTTSRKLEHGVVQSANREAYNIAHLTVGEAVCLLKYHITWCMLYISWMELKR